MMLLLVNKQQAVIQISQKRETLVISVVQTRFLLLSVFMIVFWGVILKWPYLYLAPFWSV